MRRVVLEMMLLLYGKQDEIQKTEHRNGVHKS